MTDTDFQYTYTPLEKPVRITEQDWPEVTVPLVTIQCVTYNHVNFIRDAIEGFLMQETTFPVEILIHDDASTDGTADIVRVYEAKYPQLIKPIYQAENQYSQGKKASQILRPLQRGKYIALCEADDYWIIKNKLEMQVAKMSSMANCVLVGGRVKILPLYSSDNEEIDPPLDLDLENSNVVLLENGVWLHTASRLWRKGFMDEFHSDLDAKKIKSKSDLYQILYLKSKILDGKVSALSISEIVASYRIHTCGVWSHLSETDKIISNLKIFIICRCFYSTKNYNYIDALIFSSLEHLKNNKLEVTLSDIFSIFSNAFKSGLLASDVTNNFKFTRLCLNMFKRTLRNKVGGFK